MTGFPINFIIFSGPAVTISLHLKSCLNLAKQISFYRMVPAARHKLQYSRSTIVPWIRVCKIKEEAGFRKNNEKKNRKRILYLGIEISSNKSRLWSCLALARLKAFAWMYSTPPATLAGLPLPLRPSTGRFPTAECCLQTWLALTAGPRMLQSPLPSAGHLPLASWWQPRPNPKSPAQRQTLQSAGRQCSCNECCCETRPFKEEKKRKEKGWLKYTF